MRRIGITILFIVSVLLGLTRPASAVEFCLNISGTITVFRLEATRFGNFFSLVGRERAFAERAVSGAGYIEPGGAAARLALTEPTTTVTVFYNMQLIFATLTGPFTATGTDGVITGGTIAVVPCLAED